MEENRFKMLELNWTKFVLPIAKARVLEYFYCSEEQPTYEEAEKELWIVKSCIYHHIKQLEKIWLCKIWKRGIIKWTLEDF
jgi:hypothetical protein